MGDAQGRARQEGESERRAGRCVVKMERKGNGGGIRREAENGEDLGRTLSTNAVWLGAMGGRDVRDAMGRPSLISLLAQLAATQA